MRDTSAPVDVRHTLWFPLLAPMQREIAATYHRVETTAGSQAATGNDDGDS
jgi:hypothetical protein